MSNHNLKVPEWITKDYLLEVLKNSFPKDSIVLNDYKITPGSSVGDNYACQILRIQFDFVLNGKQESLSMISKFLPVTETSQDLTKISNLFDNEKRMFTEMLPLLAEKLKHRGPKYFPSMYYCDLKNEIFHMEDLKAIGYQMADRRKGLDLQHSLLAVKSLAAHHAASYLLLQEKPDKKDNYLEVVWKYIPGRATDRFVNGGLKYFLEALDHWPLSDDQKNSCRKLKGRLYKKGCDCYARRTDRFNVLLHGDSWVNNMMFKYNEDQVQDVKLIDYQFCNYNSIGLDLNYFIFTSTQLDVKLNQQDKLLETYYEAFTGIAGDVKEFNLDKVRKEFEEGLFFGLLCELIIRPGQCYAIDLDAYLQEKDSEVNRQMYKWEPYIEEMTQLFPFFEKHGIFELDDC